MAIFQHRGQTIKRKLPQIWLMTDERMGAALLPSIQALPRGSGVVFRHYDLAEKKRLALFRRVMRIARRRGLLVMLAGSAAQARRWGADGYHGNGRENSRRYRRGSGCTTPALLRSVPVHNWREIRNNIGRGHLFFLSPIYPTPSHPGAKALGPLGLHRLACLCDGPVIALGGMTRERFAMLRSSQAHGWAAISALQRKAM